ncbi:MAG: hypothetical protein EOM26_11925 [Alphaproteobacteria bacterium]|nr:hypothetical protein [Alphaproteobacteria bacterium]
MSEEVWHQVYTNVPSAVADPLQNLSAALREDISRLSGMGISQPTDLQALALELEQAGDFGSLAERSSAGGRGGHNTPFVAIMSPLGLWFSWVEDDASGPM